MTGLRKGSLRHGNKHAGAKVDAIRMLNQKFFCQKFQKTNENIKIYDGNIRINHIDME